MKNPLLALALLLAPGLALAGHPPAGSSVFVQNSPLGTGTGIAMGDGNVMGPLCPPDICGAGPEAAAFNAAAQIPPPGTKWRSTECTVIPCALEDDPTDPRLKKGDKETPAEEPTEVSEIVVTAPRKRAPTPTPTETALGAGVTATATADGVTFKDSSGKSLTPNETQALLIAHEAATNKGFDPTGGYGQARRNPPAPGPSAVPEADVIGGMLGKGMSDLGSFGDDVPGGQTSTPGQPGQVVYKGEVDTSLTGGTSGRVDVDRNIARSRASGALGGLENAVKTGAGLTATPTDAGDLDPEKCGGDMQVCGSANSTPVP
jgi:hypothetical protein